MGRILETFRRIAADGSGAAMTEFALCLPVVTTLGLWGTELANFALVNMKVHELAIHLADNASRVGDTSTLLDRKIYESDINDLFLGSSIQASASLNFYSHGRAIASIESGARDFATVAREDSDARSSGARGGLLGTYAREDWPPQHEAIRDRAFALQIDQLSEKDLSSVGFLGYPLLQTADVVIYDADVVRWRTVIADAKISPQ